MSTPRILAFSGSTRRASFNQRLVENAAASAEKAEAAVTLIDLADYPLPLFNQDDEAVNGPPDNVTRLKSLFLEHNGLLLASPEYNGSITPLMKNTLDWVSRSYGDELVYSAYAGKTAAIMSASPGRLGGLRGLGHLRSILTNLGVLVLPMQSSISSAGSAFDDGGKLLNISDSKRVDKQVGELIRTISGLS